MELHCITPHITYYKQEHNSSWKIGLC